MGVVWCNLKKTSATGQVSPQYLNPKKALILRGIF